MRQGQIRVAVAAIILFGHLLVFVFGLSIGLFGPLSQPDAIQTILMASPVLGLSAASALTFTLRGEAGIAKGRRVTGLFSAVVLIFPISLILSIFAIFAAFVLQLNGFGPQQMKISLGGVETFFGIFLGSISQTLFGESQRPTQPKISTN